MLHYSVIFFYLEKIILEGTRLLTLEQLMGFKLSITLEVCL